MVNTIESKLNNTEKISSKEDCLKSNAFFVVVLSLYFVSRFSITCNAFMNSIISELDSVDVL